MGSSIHIGRNRGEETIFALVLFLCGGVAFREWTIQAYIMWKSIIGVITMPTDNVKG